eukprot:2278743-Prymnesium_polylepis.1
MRRLRCHVRVSPPSHLARLRPPVSSARRFPCQRAARRACKWAARVTRAASIHRARASSPQSNRDPSACAGSPLPPSRPPGPILQRRSRRGACKAQVSSERPSAAARA